MDRTTNRLLAVAAVAGALTALSGALAVADDGQPGRPAPAVAERMDFPDDHDRMLGIMRAQPHDHHLERMRADPEWQALRSPRHRSHLEDYQLEVERMLGRPATR